MAFSDATDRLITHKRFYVPAILLLFVSYPGSIFLLSAKGVSWFGGTGWAFATVCAIVNCVASMAFLLGNYSLWKKTMGEICLLGTALFFASILFQDDGVGLNFFLFLLKSKLVISFVPYFAVFCALMAVNSVKRSGAILLAQLVLIVLLGLANWKLFGSQTHFEGIKNEAIFVRAGSSGYQSNTEIFNECQRIADESKHAECMGALGSIRTVTESGVE